MEAEDEDIAYESALNDVCNKLYHALPELGIEVSIIQVKEEE